MKSVDVSLCQSRESGGGGGISSWQYMTRAHVALLARRVVPEWDVDDDHRVLDDVSVLERARDGGEGGFVTRAILGASPPLLVWPPPVILFG